MEWTLKISLLILLIFPSLSFACPELEIKEDEWHFLDGTSTVNGTLMLKNPTEYTLYNFEVIPKNEIVDMFLSKSYDKKAPYVVPLVQKGAEVYRYYIISGEKLLPYDIGLKFDSEVYYGKTFCFDIKITENPGGYISMYAPEKTEFTAVYGCSEANISKRFFNCKVSSNKSEITVCMRAYRYGEVSLGTVNFVTHNCETAIEKASDIIIVGDLPFSLEKFKNENWTIKGNITNILTIPAILKNIVVYELNGTDVNLKNSIRTVKKFIFTEKNGTLIQNRSFYFIFEDTPISSPPVYSMEVSHTLKILKNRTVVSHIYLPEIKVKKEFRFMAVKGAVLSLSLIHI